MINLEKIQNETPITLDNNNKIRVNDYDPVKLTKQYGSPLFIYSEKKILSKFDLIMDSFKDYEGVFHPYYSFKANNNEHVLRAIKKIGMGAEVCSTGEAKLALKAGFDKNDIIYHGNSKSADDLEFAISNDILIIADSIEELTQIDKIARSQYCIAKVGIRINFHFEELSVWNGSSARNKFGISKDEIRNIINIFTTSDSIKMCCLHAHLGSQVVVEDNYNLFLNEYLNLLSSLYSNKIYPDIINIGGGYPIRYKFVEDIQRSTDIKFINDFNVGEVGSFITEKINNMIITYGLQKLPKLVIELGRYIVGNSGVLLTKINSLKVEENRTWINVDAGCNLLPDIWIYDWYFECLDIDYWNNDDKYLYDIAGPLCDSGDILGINRLLSSKLVVNDLLVFVQVGAYQEVQKSNFNLMSKAGSIFVDANGKIQAIG